MADHEIKKPVLFISHASSDADFAIAVKQEIEKVFANGVSVFCTGSPGAIPVGTDWLANIENNLSLAQSVIAIITPVSIERPWLWFEVGATWANGRSGTCKIYPLCAPEVSLSNLPSPLDRLQALSLGKAADLNLLFEALIKQFGFGQLSSFRSTNITSRIPKYKDVKVVATDLNERAFYSGKYSGYGDKDLAEVIDTNLFQQDETPFPGLNTERESLIRNGKLLLFREIDTRLELPPGSAKRLMSDVAKRYGLTPAMETEHIVRYSK